VRRPRVFTEACDKRVARWRKSGMSVEIEVLNGEESWPTAKPLFEAVWPPDVVQKLSWGHVRWANADLRVMIETPSDGLACHVGITSAT
jgi:aminoglycoside 2'-N-acetyltransferase I